MNYGLVNSTGELMERMHSVNATNYGDALILMTRQLNQIYLDYGYVSDGVSIIEYQGYDPEEHPEYGYFDLEKPSSNSQVDFDKFYDEFGTDRYDVIPVYLITSENGYEFRCAEDYKDAVKAANALWQLSDCYGGPYVIYNADGDEVATMENGLLKK